MDPPGPVDPALPLHAPGELLAHAGPIELAPGRVHAWAFELAAAAPVMAHCVALLDDGERARADRFLREALRERFRVAHGVMRHLLARYAGVGAAELAFAEADEGKPRLAGTAAGRLAFNLSHSESRAVVVVGAAGQELGVDVERERASDDLAGIVRGYFTGEEAKRILEGPPASQSREFFRHWVAKEAVLKAQGGGLTLPLDGFRVAFGDDDRACVVPVGAAPIRADWTLRLRSLGAGWPVAVCAAGEDWTLEAPPPGALG